jgi:uncharacterized iron-regulated membrane protein
MRRATVGRVLGAVLGAVLAGALPARAQQPQAAVLPEAITVGDVFHAAIRIELPAGARLAAPDSLVLPPDLEPAGRREVRVDSAGGTRRATVLYPLTAWRPGDYAIAPATLRLYHADGAEVELAAALPGFVVRSVLPADTADIEPQPARDVLGASRLWWPLLLLVLLLALVAAALLAWWRRRARAGPAAVVEVPAVPPREAALARLDALRDAGLLERGELKPFYAELTETLRRYAAAVEPRWGVDLTSSELAARLRAAGFADGVDLLRILGTADMVKFARARPSPADAARDLDLGRGWVERVPAAEPADAADERRAA